MQNQPQLSEAVAQATLALEFDWIRAFCLSNGQLTRDRQAAEQDRQRRIALRQTDTDAATAALLRVPVVAKRRPTPARVEIVRDLAVAGVLPACVHSHAESLTAIRDELWEPISRLHDLLHPEEVEHYCWILSLADASGHPLDVPTDYDPWAYSGDDPPIHMLYATLGALRKQGWHAVSVDVEESPSAFRCHLVRSKSIQRMSEVVGETTGCKGEH